ncbi:S8 family serine peptidase [Mycoplasmopsis bovirhinis]|uniref:Subtilase family n=1 Tax=Mycoplasmopsis bovirhinis TaxID=29553 RepID=A0A449AF00_9BACT|nr:S8 family serine peptidase [Mycoplasmopsis bovirhinis]VEU63580.1 Subtilase family [Mycoplasmopsis bovirhinis]VEU63583.1 Subtilase family [Mycoplasmopsis bovirhinis]
MNKLKFKKLVIWPVETLGSFASFVAILPQNYTQKITNWYENLNNYKFEVRDQSAITVQNNNGDLEITPVNNNFELKLLLNPEFKIQNEELISNFNMKFIQKVNLHNLIYKSFEKLSMMPIVWFYFESESDRQSFVNAIKDWNEIYKFIIFKNKQTSQNSFINVADETSERDQSSIPSISSSHYPGAPVDLNHHLFKSSFNHNSRVVNAQDHLDNPYVNKIGILEVWSHSFDQKYQNYFKNGIEINDLPIEPTPGIKSHSTNVSLIAGGKYGIDRSSKIYLHTFERYDSHWMTTIEKMVKQDGIKLINHSYGMYILDNHGNVKKGMEKYTTDYSENAYFVDYISRKYGVINVFVAGNEGRHKNNVISETSASFNSVVVGALKGNASEINVKSNLIANYSNYGLIRDFQDISKPLVVAPGQIYTTVHGEYRYAAGTSYAAPIVTGLISNLMKYKEDIRNSNNRVPIVKAILSASAVSPKLQNLTYKTSGYEQKYGSGTVDFKAMLQAANNYKVKTLNSNSSNNTILTSDEIKLTKGQTIKISSSWTFNAGLLKERVINPLLIDDRNWWNDVYNTTPKYRPKDLVAEARKWDNQHENELWLKKEEMLNRQSNKWFTDYDLFLEQKNSNGDWITVKRVSTILTNDELIEHKADVAGTYRYKILKFSSNSFDNSVDDIVAVTHVVRNENE